MYLNAVRSRHPNVAITHLSLLDFGFSHSWKPTTHSQLSPQHVGPQPLVVDAAVCVGAFEGKAYTAAMFTAGMNSIWL
jgi:hypothetical protein